MSGLLRLSMYVVALALAVFPGAVFGQLIDPLPDPIFMGNVSVTLTPVNTGLTTPMAPNGGTFAPGLTQNHLFVIDQSGPLWVLDFDIGTTNDKFLDLSGLLEFDALDPASFKERGFLGVAFHPDYATNGLLYTSTSEPVLGTAEAADFTTLPAGVLANHRSVISEWQVANPTDLAAARTPDNTPRRILLRIDQPQSNHNGGAIGFGPDGMLYIALGDGGQTDDQGDGHVDGGNGRNPGNVLGSMLRIDPRSRNAANGQYGIPADNPFVSPGAPAPLGGQNGCVDGKCDEIYAYGFQNPSRFSFDASASSPLLYVSDAGQFIQEIDIVVGDGHYGWNQKEGAFTFNANGDGEGFLSENAPNNPVGIIDPVAQYDRDEGIDVVGGFVYRSQSSTLLSARYIFGDAGYTAGNLSQCAGRLFVLQEDLDFGPLTDGLVRANDRLIRSSIAELGQGQLNDLCILGFAQDAADEGYVLANQTGTPFPDAVGNPTGVIMKINAP